MTIADDQRQGKINAYIDDWMVKLNEVCRHVGDFADFLLPECCGAVINEACHRDVSGY